MLERIKRDWLSLRTSIKFTLNKGLFISQSRTGFPDFLELFSLLIIPSTYIIIISWFETFNDITKSFGKWWLYSDENSLTGNVFDVLDHLNNESILDLDIHDKERVKITLDRIYKIDKVINSDIDEVFDMWTTYK